MSSRRPGLLEQFGLPESEEQLLQKRVQEGLLSARQGAANMGFGHASERAAADVGAQLGVALASKLGGVLTPEEKIKTKIVSDANDDFKNIKDAGTLTPEQESVEYLMAIARAASDNGRQDMAAEAAMAASQRKFMMRKQELELDKLEIGNQRTQQLIDVTRDDNYRREAGQYKAWLPADADGTFDFANIQDKAVTGKVDQHGRLTIEAPDGTTSSTTQYISYDDALAMRDRFLRARQRVGNGEDPRKVFMSLVGQTDRRMAQERKDSVNGQIKIMDAVADKFIEWSKPGSGTSAASLVGNVGAMNQLVNSISAQFDGLRSSFRVWIGDEGEDPTVRMAGKGSVGQQIINSGKYDDEISRIQVPEAIRDSGRNAAEYRSMIVELAYATARANEPGARQLSDQDFRRALEQIGAATGDPATFAQVIFNNMSRKADSVRSDLSRITGQAQSVGLDGNVGLQMVYGTNDFTDFEDRISAIDNKYQELGYWLSGTDPNQISVGGVSGTIQDGN